MAVGVGSDGVGLVPGLGVPSGGSDAAGGDVVGDSIPGAGVADGVPDGEEAGPAGVDVAAGVDTGPGVSCDGHVGSGVSTPGAVGDGVIPPDVGGWDGSGLASSMGDVSTRDGFTGRSSGLRGVQAPASSVTVTTQARGE